MLLSGHTGEVFSCSFSPDGQHLASGSYDKNICKAFIMQYCGMHMVMLIIME